MAEHAIGQANPMEPAASIELTEGMPEETLGLPDGANPQNQTHSDLPGYEELVNELVYRLSKPGPAATLKHLYLEDVRQQSLKLFEDYMRYTDPTSSTPQTAWDSISDGLRDYSEAVERWNEFEVATHDSVFRSLSNDTDVLELAARSHAVEVYQDRCRDRITDAEATQLAIAEERRRLRKSKLSLDLNLGRLKTRAEKQAQETREESEKNKDERKSQRYQAFWGRFSMALFGGVSLIVPMLIMSLHDTRVTSLATTSVFTLVVAVLLALFMTTAESKDIVAATAAYAAVLVVFVGSTTEPIPAENLNPLELGRGEIAGIVLGTLGGLFLLMVLTLYCCCKGVWHFVLEIFGIRRRKPRRVDSEIYEKRETSSRSQRDRVVSHHRA